MTRATEPQHVTEALRVVVEQMAQATAAPRCHACGCFHQTVEALERAAPPEADLADVLAKASLVFVAKKYDCRGCDVCFPAVAENAFADAYPGAARASSCATDLPAQRPGWPPLPGDYRVTRYHAPVAVCSLNTEALVTGLDQKQPAGLSIVGTLHTENLGIERVIRNVLANPNIRFLGTRR